MRSRSPTPVYENLGAYVVRSRPFASLGAGFEPYRSCRPFLSRRASRALGEAAKRYPGNGYRPVNALTF